MRLHNQPPTSETVAPPAPRSERGFTLIEVVIAMLIMTIAVLGTASLFVFSVRYNSGSRDRAMALAVAQRRLERLRNVPFDDPLLNATAANPTPVTVNSYGRNYSVTTVVTNTPGSLPNPATSPRRKLITITVRPQGGRTAANGVVEWSFAPVTITTLRAATKIGNYIH